MCSSESLSTEKCPMKFSVGREMQKLLLNVGITIGQNHKTLENFWRRKINSDDLHTIKQNC